MLDATSVTAARVWRPSLTTRMVIAITAAVLIAHEVGILPSSGGEDPRSVRLASIGVAVGALAVFQYVRLELHAQHLVLRSVPSTRVLPLAEIHHVTVDRYGLVFWCGNGRRISGPPAIGEPWWIARLIGRRTRTDEMIDEILAAARRSRRRSRVAPAGDQP